MGKAFKLNNNYKKVKKVEEDWSVRAQGEKQRNLEQRCGIGDVERLEEVVFRKQGSEGRWEMVDLLR